MKQKNLSYTIIYGHHSSSLRYTGMQYSISWKNTELVLSMQDSRYFSAIQNNVPTVKGKGFTFVLEKYIFFSRKHCTTGEKSH